MSYFDIPVDPNMIISKILTKTDVTGNIALPAQQVMSVLTMMNDATPEKLQNGIEVEVVDIVETDTYHVTLRCIDNTRYYFGDGWSTIKHSMELQEGELFKLVWDHKLNKFIVLNYAYQLL